MRSNAEPDSYANGDSHSDTDTDIHTYTNCDRYFDSYSYANRDSYSDSGANRNLWSKFNSYSDQHSNSNTYTDCYRDGKRESHPNPYGERGCDSSLWKVWLRTVANPDSNSDFYADTDCHCLRKPEPDINSNSDGNRRQ